jgi:tetratricopeptide (TPR) repeat protein
MNGPPWQPLTLNAGILREPVPNQQRLVLCLRRQREGKLQYWERVSTVPGAAITTEPGWQFTAATSITARQHPSGFLGRLFRFFQRTTEESIWLLPNGCTAEQCGERQTDLWLVWGNPNSPPLDLALVQSRWPGSSRIEPLGPNLFLVRGVANLSKNAPSSQISQLCSQIGTLTDEAIAVVCKGQLPRAVNLLTQALELARQAGDKSNESDVLGQLGLTAQKFNELPQARAYFEEALSTARAAGERYQEKLALERLGTVSFRLADHAGAQTYYAQALTLAREAGDHKHAAELLWYLAILAADADQQEQAITHAQAAVELFQQIGHPQTAGFAEHLRKYRLGETTTATLPTPAAQSQETAEAFTGTSLDIGVGTAVVATAAAQETIIRGPGLLRMALSVTRSLAEFVGSGLQTVPTTLQEQRLRTCAACPYHTGQRCRLCGCFTALKAKLPHERCPLDRWPA